MNLSQEQKATFVRKLQQQGWGTNCPICKNSRWTISDTIFELREFQGKGFHVGGAMYPVITLTCETCGNTIIFNAIIMGILTPPGSYLGGNK